MNQFKPSQVIMLPVINRILFVNRFNKMFINNNYRDGETYDIYITSDDKIEKNDWCMIIDKASSLYGEFEQHKGSHSRSDQWGKIIATTDTSLGFIIPRFTSGNRGAVDVSEKILLPQPSQQFIEKYIESYNKGEVITDVLVEYKSYCKHGNNCPSKGAYDKQHLCNVDYKIKVNQDNTINIKQVKDSWTREEVLEELNLLYSMKNSTVDTFTDEEDRITMKWFNQ